MAGGTFNKNVEKVRPGTYINFESTRQDTVGNSERGVVIVPIAKPTYGPARKFITLTAKKPDAGYSQLGYSIYDGENRQMLLIREAFKRASTVLVYILGEGKKATATAEPITATAKYGGTRGNDLYFAVAANPVKGFDVKVCLGTKTVAEYEGLNTVEELVAQDCEYITFSGSGELISIAGKNLTGGTDPETSNEDISAFCDAWESVKFNTVCFPFVDSSIQAAAKTKIRYIREDIGKGVQVVMPDTASGDYEGVINVTNSVAVDGISLTNAEACAWVAAATAAATGTESLTQVSYDGATEVVDPKSHEEAVEAINKGEFFFSVSDAGEVVVEYDINSLVTYVKPKDKTYRKNKVIRVFDTFAEALRLNFPPNKYSNDDEGWDIMEGIGRSILKQFGPTKDGGIGMIKNIDYSNDFLVDRELSDGDQTYFNVGLQPTDNAEKLYFTIATR